MAEESNNPDRLEPPSLGYLALESLAPLEFPALLAAAPVLGRAPRGDGHAVLIVPGFAASDTSTGPLRYYLNRLGYEAHGWGNGRNDGPSPENLDALRRRFFELYHRTGRKVSLIGWSLGGVFVRELSRNHPEMVRLVITMASPFRDVSASNVRRVWRMVASPEAKQVRRRSNPQRSRELARPIPVPATAIYTRTDGVVAAKACQEVPGPTAENIQVNTSHCGIGMNPAALWAVADRLAQPDGQWRKFKPGPAARVFFPKVH